MAETERKTKRCPTDLTDAGWARIAPLLAAPHRRGRPRRTDLREALNAICCLVRTGCGWRMLPMRRIVWRHALPNALAPTLNITALNLAYLVGGVVVVEKVFSYPGFGSLLVDMLQLRDLPVIEATVLLAAAVYIFANLVADIAAILLTPRLRDRG